MQHVLTLAVGVSYKRSTELAAAVAVVVPLCAAALVVVCRSTGSGCRAGVLSCVVRPCFLLLNAECSSCAVDFFCLENQELALALELY